MRRHAKSLTTGKHLRHLRCDVIVLVCCSLASAHNLSATLTGPSCSMPLQEGSLQRFFLVKVKEAGRYMF